MKTTIDLPDDLVREAKLRALLEGRTLRDLIADYVRQGLGLSGEDQWETPIRSSKVRIGANGLPVIAGRADAPASRMSVDELLELEQQAQEAEDICDVGRPV